LILTSDQSKEAAEAIRQIDTNAVPYLLAWIRELDPAWKTNLGGTLENLNQGLVPGWLRSGDPLCYYAGQACRVLGPTASSAIPELTRLANDDTNAQDRRVIAIEALAHLGQGGFPPLLSLLTNQDRDIAIRAALYIRYQGRNAGPAIPLLLQCLADSRDEQMAEIAAETLGKLALDANRVVPALSNALHHPGADTRRRTVNALARFRDDARIAPAIAMALSDADGGVREAANNALRKIAPEALTNAPPE